ncbi:hypothetical protein NDK50_26995 [Paraburkholderia bryophila]|uniref:hypothetical protein n=1 Tax=Paraburkholderia bryophila TaxID=420952 RepID=UPI00234ACB57|nr:hypothetical protein [Paraburkholderia bryophila]WCM24459.1 hypothetical protein NDK50_26995 [Paraburkholderia bryophila]
MSRQVKGIGNIFYAVRMADWCANSAHGNLLNVIDWKKRKDWGDASRKFFLRRSTELMHWRNIEIESPGLSAHRNFWSSDCSTVNVVYRREYRADNWSLVFQPYPVYRRI